MNANDGGDNGNGLSQAIMHLKSMQKHIAFCGGFWFWFSHGNVWSVSSQHSCGDAYQKFEFDAEELLTVYFHKYNLPTFDAYSTDRKGLVAMFLG